MNYEKKMFDKIKILFINFDLNEVDSLLNIIYRCGVESDYFSCNEEELTGVYEKEQWDLIIAGISNLNDLSISDYLNSQNVNIPYVFISNNPNEYLAVRAIRSGAYSFISQDVDSRIKEVIFEITNKMITTNKRQQLLVNKEIIQSIDKKNESVRDSEPFNNLIQQFGNELIFDKLFNFIHTPLVILKFPELSISAVNPAFLDTFYLPKEKIIGSTLSSINIFSNSFEYEEAIKAGQFESCEFELVRRSDELVFNSCVEALSGQNYHSVVCSFEMLLITKNNEFQTILNTQKELNQLKAKFLTLVSRELRTPLTNIMLSVDLLKRLPEQDSLYDRNKFLMKIQDTVLQMTQLMENVQLISKIDLEKYSANLEELDINSFCRTIADNIEFSFKRKGTIKIEINTINNIIYADEELLGLILGNILSNAAKYSDLSKEILFNVICDEKFIRISLKDNGIGIPHNEISEIYSMFFRATNAKHHSGYGLGLFIVHRCIEVYGGSINIISDKNIGTTVNISLPLKKKIRIS
ncbi:MAG: HAMP domain-containing sensor histidine kinase [Candidatus Kapabacteria bacterium]|nr:HAMP domain-containing sensor histidine kinase [Candidatus Kapabacteria bacterium]